MHILVVEDDSLIREFVVETLREEGFHVIHASTGEEALAWCRRRAADLLVTDIRLPGEVDGWEIAERCRKHHPDLPVIYATGFSPVTPRPVPVACCCRSHSTLRTSWRPSAAIPRLTKIGARNENA
jgi:DNA-binding response OmpR family regulator